MMSSVERLTWSSRLNYHCLDNMRRADKVVFVEFNQQFHEMVKVKRRIAKGPSVVIPVIIINKINTLVISTEVHWFSFQ